MYIYVIITVIIIIIIIIILIIIARRTELELVHIRCSLQNGLARGQTITPANFRQR